VNFDDRLGRQAHEIEQAIHSAMHDDYPGGTFWDAALYAVSGGKRLRGFLVLESAALHDVPVANAMPAAVAIEAIHAYSLVHDDLPCMDDDDLRRGKPTVHRKWDEATAVLAGDALQSFAFERLAGSGLAPDRTLDLIRTLARASGGAGMVYGQALDIAAETSDQPLDLDAITRLQGGKTGALIEWSATAGARMAGADTRPLLGFSRALGLAFQIADDILDLTGDEAKAGKRLKKDADAGKATFVSLLGLDGARRKARDLVAEAIDALCIYDARADNLREAARFVVSRDF
jgi:farnesyl diphosphate synthase